MTSAESADAAAAAAKETDGSAEQQQQQQPQQRHTAAERSARRLFDGETSDGQLLASSGASVTPPNTFGAKARPSFNRDREFCEMLFVLCSVFR